MMRKFELCFPLDDEPSNRYLIPDLLPKEEPDTGNWDDALAFEYHYNVLPNSIITRFIVRTHPYISKHTYWRTGVVLANEEGNKALVKSDREEKIIYIRVSGNPSTKRNLLAVARGHFDHIHKTIPGIKAEEKVRYQGTLLDYQDLLDLEKAGEPTWYVPKLKKRVNVKEILNGFESERDRREENYEFLHNTSSNLQISNNEGNIVINNNSQQEPKTMTKDQKSKPSPRVKSSWANGLFYLFLFVVVISLLTWVAGQVSFWVLGLIIIAGLLFISLIGALQLRQDDRLSQKSFLELMAMVLKQLPLIAKLLRNQKQKEDKN